MEIETKADKLSKRVIELDLLRGVAVLLMILDHFMFDLWGLLPTFFRTYPENIADFAMKYWDWDVRTAIRTVVLFIFFSLTGVCSSFSRSNLKRGGKLMAVAMLLTLFTFIIGKIADYRNLTIVFGVLHCIALSLLCVGLTERLHWNRYVYLAVGVILWGIGIVISVRVDAHLIGYGTEPFFPLLGKTILGFAQCGSDSFDFPTTCGQIFVGVFLGKWLYRERKSLFGKPYRNNPITFMGRHSLWVYFIHQLLLPLLAALVLVCLEYSFMI